MAETDARDTRASLTFDRLPGLDGLRGIAAGLVVLVHAPRELWPETQEWMVTGGFVGVHTFFVLSGFLITSLLLHERARTGTIALGAFLGRRARRLLPALVAFVAVLVVVAAVGPRLSGQSVFFHGVYIVTFTWNVVQVGNDVPVLTSLIGERMTVFDGEELTHIWSVAVEAHFYVLWALCLWAVSRVRWSHRVVLALAAGFTVLFALWRALELDAKGEARWMIMYVQTHARLDAPFLGAVLGVAFAAGWLRVVPSRLAAWLGIAGCAVIGISAVTSDMWSYFPYGGYLNVVVALGAGLALLGIVQAPGSLYAQALSVRPLRFLGTISYSLYVFHPLIFQSVRRADPAWLPSGPIRFLVVVAAAVGLAWVSYRLVELPFLRRKRRPQPEPVREEQPAFAT